MRWPLIPRNAAVIPAKTLGDLQPQNMSCSCRYCAIIAWKHPQSREEVRASCVVCLYMSLCLSVCLFFRSFSARFISNQINQHTSDEENHTFKTTDPHMFNRGPIWGLEISARGSAWYDLIRYEWNREWNWILDWNAPPASHSLLTFSYNWLALSNKYSLFFTLHHSFLSDDFGGLFFRNSAEVTDSRFSGTANIEGLYVFSTECSCTWLIKDERCM